MIYSYLLQATEAQLACLWADLQFNSHRLQLRTLTCKAVIKKTEKSLGTRSINRSMDYGVTLNKLTGREQNFMIKSIYTMALLLSQECL